MGIATIAEAKQSAPAPGTGNEGQTFLVGSEIYLRGVETADARVAMSWRPTLFPVSPECTEEWIKDDLVKEEDSQFLVIVRKSDDRVVGSVKIQAEDMHHWLDARVDRLYGARGLAWKGEAIRLLAAWIVDERGQPVVAVEVAADETPVIAAVEAMGMRQSARFREMFERDSGRVDRLIYEYLNPAWLAIVGDPSEAPLERTGTGEARPVLPPAVIEGDPPRNAMMVGKRVYLRPQEQGSGAHWAVLDRQESETFFDIGRQLTSSVTFKKWIEDDQKPDLLSWIRMSVCLRENDEPIGDVALCNVNYQSRTAETASFVAPAKYRGNGFGSEAKHPLLEYAFEGLGLHMVESWVLFPNTRSAAALRKQGYSEAGRINWLYPYNGSFGGCVVFDLLAEEWRSIPRKAWMA